MRHCGSQGWLEAGGAAAVPLPRLAWQADQRSGEGRADRRAGNPARLEGRVDFAAREREAAGDGRRRRRTAPVPLPPRIPGAAGAGEIRQVDSLRRASPRASEGDVRAHGKGSARPRTGQRGRGTADQSRLVPRRVRALRTRIAHVRDHDAEQESRVRSRQSNRRSGSAASNGSGSERRSSTRSSRTRSRNWSR